MQQARSKDNTQEQSTGTATTAGTKTSTITASINTHVKSPSLDNKPAIHSQNSKQNPHRLNNNVQHSDWPVTSHDSDTVSNWLDQQSQKLSGYGRVGKEKQYECSYAEQTLNDITINKNSKQENSARCLNNFVVDLTDSYDASPLGLKRDNRNTVQIDPTDSSANEIWLPRSNR